MRDIVLKYLSYLYGYKFVKFVVFLPFLIHNQTREIKYYTVYLASHKFPSCKPESEIRADIITAPHSL